MFVEREHSSDISIKALRRTPAQADTTTMIIRDPEVNFEELWKTFYERYPFFEVRGVDWKKQHDTFRPKVTQDTTDDELFDIFCEMLEPLNDGHVKIRSKATEDRKKRYYTP